MHTRTRTLFYRKLEVFTFSVKQDETLMWVNYTRPICTFIHFHYEDSGDTKPYIIYGIKERSYQPNVQLVSRVISLLRKLIKLAVLVILVLLGLKFWRVFIISELREWAQNQFSWRGTEHRP